MARFRRIKYKTYGLRPYVLLFMIHSLLLANPLATTESGNLVGTIRDAQSGEKLGWTKLYIEELNRSVTAHDDGQYHFYELPQGTYHLQVFRVGYHDRKIKVSILAGQTVQHDIKLTENTLYTETIVVEEVDDVQSIFEQPDLQVSGGKLRQNLGQTLAGTLDMEAGLSQRSMGPAPARPVLRGLSGDRVLIVEDGQRTGDLSATSADHAVVIEPVNADFIEIIRGPRALTYGSNTIGGVIDVTHDYIPHGLPHRVTGTVSMQGETVNRGFVSGLKLTIPAAPFAFSIDGSWRSATNLKTPKGELKNTGINTYNFSAGTGYYRQWGNFGAASTRYRSEYGIPPLPAKLGGHPGGVEIEMERDHYEASAELYHSFALLNRSEFTYTYTDYFHAEYHTRGVSPDRTQFGVETHHLQGRFYIPECGCGRKGQLGFWTEFRDYSSAGLNFTPNTTERAAAIYGYQEFQWKKIALAGALRYDVRNVRPDEERYSVFLDGLIRERTFSGFSGAAGIRYAFAEDWNANLNFFRSLRTPGVEELYSEGPHLAAYAYEIGSANLNTERGLGTEIGLTYQSEQIDFKGTIYRNAIRGYIFPQNTNQRSFQRNDLFVYRYTGAHAIMYGAEATGHWHMFRGWNIDATVSYVHGTLANDEHPLPRIPPLQGKIGLYFKSTRLKYGLFINHADAQNRTGQFETATEGYVVLDLFAQYNIAAGRLLHTVSLRVNNLTNTVYYQHLNRVKEIMPEAGRNVKLLYRFYF
ncbi:MAG: TonB-dependent receptor [Caldithrix sp.]|nr:TonB-dependent receptor [Caldithrix sp.]